jgi:two-component system phosphate regulon sensor histidine kinase PhoR
VAAGIPDLENPTPAAPVLPFVKTGRGERLRRDLKIFGGAFVLLLVLAMATRAVLVRAQLDPAGAATLIAVLFALLVVVPVAVGYWMIRRNDVAMGAIIDRLRESVRGSGRESIFDASMRGDQALLAILLDDLRVNLKAQIEGYERRRVAIARILDSLGEGLVAVDTDGRVTLANRRIAEIFGTGPVEPGRRLVEVVRNAKLLEAFDHALEGREIAERLTISQNGESRVIEIRAFAVDRAPDIAAVALLIDVTRIQQLEKTRREFLADFSHEVRTPLAGISSAIESLESGGLTKDDEEQLRRIITRQLGRLERLVRDLAELNEIESGGIVLHRKPVDLLELARELAQDLHGRDARVRVEVDGDPCEVSVDSGRIEQVLTNLVENAIKHGGTGKAFVEVHDRGNECRVAVIDHGPGILSREIENIFLRLYRVDRSRARQVAGSGLGLAITKHLVLLHGGKIQARSNPEEGTVFEFTIPRG